MSSTLLDRTIFYELHSFSTSVYIMSSALLDRIIFYELHSSWPHNILWAPLFLTAYYFMSSTLLDHSIFYELHSSWPHNILWAPLFLIAYYFMSSILLDRIIFYELRSSWPRRRRRRTWSSTWRGRWTWRCWAREDAEAAAGRRTAGLRSEFKLHRVGRELSFFYSRRNWDSPIPSPAGECAPHPLVQGWEAHSHSLAGEGLGESQFRRGDIHCGTLYSVHTVYVSTLCEIAFSHNQNCPILDLR